MVRLRGLQPCCTILLSCLILFGSAFQSNAQDDESDFLEGFVAGGSLLIQALVLDLEPLESLMSTQFNSDIEFADQPLFLTFGGAGFAGRELRIGLFGITGSWAGEVQQSAFDSATLNLNYDGLFVEQQVFSESPSQFSVGALFGAGVWKIEMLSGDAITFEDSLLQPSALLLEREFVMLQPYVSTEYHWGTFGLQFQVGVLGTFSTSPWFLPGRVELEGGPLSMSLIPSITISVIFGV